jgi:hypothetical protein
MWADNEADLDLLGFDFLVDELVVALTEPRLLPLTIGVLGDWGSGKSSLMQIAARELNDHHEERAQAGGEDLANAPYLTINFSPWQYEDHNDVKIALMSAVLDAISTRVPDAEERVGRLRRILDKLGRLGRRVGRAGAGAAPTVLPIILQGAMPEMDSGTMELVTAATNAAASEAHKALDDPSPHQPSVAGNPGTPTGDVDMFRREFAALVENIPGCEAVIVFIDDLDRCLPETVVDTFEAIRLFLNTPKTAYVLALNQNVVESAVDSRYPELRKQDGAGIGRDYLEKMLQLKIAIPPLSAPEAETYVNLLFAELHLNDEEFAKVLKQSVEVRRGNGLAVAFNTGIAGDVLGDIPAKLAADLKWAADISPVMGASLRGNPRQLKRFLNNLLLKHRSAVRRGAALELPVLAKLMVLEDQYNTDFQKLFDWELAAGGACSEIKDAEAHARIMPGGVEAPKTAGKTPAGDPQPTRNESRAATKEAPAAPLNEARNWASKTHIAEWLRADPAFAGIDLRPYFTYSRDKLSFGVSASRLAPHLQRLITDVQSDIDASRRQQYAAVSALDSNDRAQFVEALLERVQRDPSSTALTAVLELAEKNPDMVSAVSSALQRIPPSAIPVVAGSMAVRRLPRGNADVAALFDRWETSENVKLRTVVTQARKASETKGGPGGNFR